MRLGSRSLHCPLPCVLSLGQHPDLALIFFIYAPVHLWGIILAGQELFLAKGVLELVLWTLVRDLVWTSFELGVCGVIIKLRVRGA